MPKFSFSAVPTQAKEIKKTENPLIDSNQIFVYNDSKQHGLNLQKVQTIETKPEFSLKAKPTEEKVQQVPIQQVQKAPAPHKDKIEISTLNLLAEAEKKLQLDPVVKQSEEELNTSSHYKANRNKFLEKLISKNFNPDQKDSLQDKIYKPETILKWQNRNIQQCEQENGDLVNISVLKEFVKKLSKKPNQRINVFEDIHFEYPFYKSYDTLPATLISGELDSELATLQLSTEQFTAVKAPFIQLQIKFQEILNKFSAQNLTSAVSQIDLAILTVTRDFQQILPFQKSILFYLIHQISLKAGLEKNFLDLYVDLLQELAKSQTIIDMIFESEHDKNVFNSKIGSRQLTPEIKSNYRLQYTANVFRHLIKQNLADQFETKIPSNNIIKFIDSDVPEVTAYKQELQKIYFLNLYKFAAKLTLSYLLDIKFSRAIFEKLANDACEDHNLIKIVCDVLIILFGEITWMIDLHYVDQHKISTQANDEVRKFVDNYFADPDYQYGYLADILQGKDKVLDNKVLNFYELKCSLVEIYQQKISKIVIDDALIGFNIREVQYGLDEKYVKTSLNYKRYLNKKQASKQNRNMTVNQQVSKKIVSIQFDDNNWAQFYEVLIEGTILEAFVEIFKIDESSIKNINWQKPLLQLLNKIISEKKQVSQNIQKLFKFCDQQPMKKVLQSIILTEKLQHDDTKQVILTALNSSFIQFGEYMQFVSTLSPSNELQNFVNSVFVELTEEIENDDEDVTSVERYLQLAKKSELFNIINSLLTVNNIQADIKNAFNQLKTYKLEEMFVDYCLNIDVNLLLNDESLDSYLQNAQFYSFILLKIGPDNQEKLTQVSNIRKPSFRIVSKSAMMFWKENCESDDSIVLFYKTCIENNICTKDDVVNWFKTIPAVGPLAILSQNEQLKKLLK